LNHSVLLSEFFLGLVPQDGKHPAKIPTRFRWIPGEYLDLPFSEFMPENRKEKRRLQPDAVLEIPSLRKRYFAEIETGSATIWDQEKLTSTLAKLNRYSNFIRGYAGAGVSVIGLIEAKAVLPVGLGGDAEVDARFLTPE